MCATVEGRCLEYLVCITLGGVKGFFGKICAKKKSTRRDVYFHLHTKLLTSYRSMYEVGTYNSEPVERWQGGGGGSSSVEQGGVGGGARQGGGGREAIF